MIDNFGDNYSPWILPCITCANFLSPSFALVISTITPPPFLPFPKLFPTILFSDKDPSYKAHLISTLALLKLNVPPTLIFNSPFFKFFIMKCKGFPSLPAVKPMIEVSSKIYAAPYALNYFLT